MTPPLSTPHVAADRMLDLLHDLTAPEAASEIFAHLRHCTECEAGFRTLARDREEIQAGAQPRSIGGRVVLVPPVTTALELAPHDASAWHSRRAWRIASLAAAATLALGLGVPRMLSRSARPAAATIPLHVLPAEQEFVLQRASTVFGIATLERAKAAYDRGAWSTVIEILDVDTARADAEPSWSKNPIRRLYLASACIHTGRFARARELLANEDVAHWPQPSRREAQWVLYVAARQMGDDRDADALLQQLVPEDNAIGALARAERWRRAASQSGKPLNTKPAQ